MTLSESLTVLPAEGERGREGGREGERERSQVLEERVCSQYYTSVSILL